MVVGVACLHPSDVGIQACSVQRGVMQCQLQAIREVTAVVLGSWPPLPVPEAWLAALLLLSLLCVLLLMMVVLLVLTCWLLRQCWAALAPAQRPTWGAASWRRAARWWAAGQGREGGRQKAVLSGLAETCILN